MQKLSDKTEFILAFAALVLGLSGISSGIRDVRVNLGFSTHSLWELGLVVFSLLFFSIYLYALDSIRYGISVIEDWKIFKLLKRVADISYLLAIMFPLLIFFIWLGVLALNHIPVKYLRDNISTISAIFSILSTLFSLISSWKHLQEKEKIVYEKIDEKTSQLILETNKLLERKDWRLAVIEAFRLLELMFKDKALDIGIDTNKLPFVRLIHVFVDKEILNKPQAAKLDHVRELRNLAVHSSEKITKEQAAFVTDVIGEVTKSLSSTRFIGGYFEGNVMDALSKLFPKHHIFPQYNLGNGNRADFMAEGPRHNYYVEVKMVESGSLVRRAFRQLHSTLGEKDRGILVLPIEAEQIVSEDSRIKIAYFDIQNGEFANQQIIYNWIYNKH